MITADLNSLEAVVADIIDPTIDVTAGVVTIGSNKWFPASSVASVAIDDNDPTTFGISIQLRTTYPLWLRFSTPELRMAAFLAVRQAYRDYATAASQLVATGSAPSPVNLIAGNTADVVVPLSRTMNSAGYVTFVTLEAPAAVLGVVEATVVSKTTTTATVRVKNTSLATLGQSVTINVLAVG